MSGPSSQDEEKWDDCDCDVSNYCCYWVSGSDPVRGSWSISRVYTDSDTAASWPLVTTLMTQDTHIPCSQTGVTPLMILTWDPFNDPVMIPYHLKCGHHSIHKRFCHWHSKAIWAFMHWVKDGPHLDTLCCRWNQDLRKNLTLDSTLSRIFSKSVFCRTIKHHRVLISVSMCVCSVQVQCNWLYSVNLFLKLSHPSNYTHWTWQLRIF